MKRNNEFANKPFYPAKFFWRNSNSEEIKRVCRILNELTREQIWAVEIFGDNKYSDGEYDVQENS